MRDECQISLKKMPRRMRRLRRLKLKLQKLQRSNGCNNPDSSTFQQYESAACRPLQIQIRLKHKTDERKTEEDVHTGGDVDVNEKKEEATLVEECNSWRTSFKGLPQFQSFYICFTVRRYEHEDNSYCRCCCCFFLTHLFGL